MGGVLGRNWYQRILEGGEQDAERKPMGMHMAAWEPGGMGQSHVDYSRDTGKGEVGCTESGNSKSGSAAKLGSKWKAEKYADRLHEIVEMGSSALDDYPTVLAEGEVAWSGNMTV